jgi:segregation and condensation protein B
LENDQDIQAELDFEIFPAGANLADTAGAKPAVPDASGLSGENSAGGDELDGASQKQAYDTENAEDSTDPEDSEKIPLEIDLGNAAYRAAIVEAVLFLESEPIDEKQIARITSLDENAVETSLEILKERYSQAASGIEIVRIGGGITIAPKKGYWDMLKERYGRKNMAKLSRAAMETLAIIAYSQPITRAEIEAIRGVQADNMIRLLVERGLVRETGKKDIAGRPVQFGTTKEFLSLFRLESIADLPKLDESEAERFELQD